jgi:hypothetical protein
VDKHKQKLREQLVKKYGEPQNLDELAQMVIKAISSYSYEGKRTPVVGFAWDIHYDSVSNSHDCPINGKTNWSRREVLEDGSPAPTSYQGWQGRVWIRYRRPTPSFGSDPFEDTLTYPGTGGAGSYDGPFEGISTARYRRYGHNDGPNNYPEPQAYSWDYRFFEDDWPALKTWREKQQVIAALSGTRANLNHRFEWWDPKTREQDDEFLNDPATIYASEVWHQQHEKIKSRY